MVQWQSSSYYRVVTASPCNLVVEQTKQLKKELVTYVKLSAVPGLVEIKNFRLVCPSLSPWKTTLHLSK